MYQKFKSFLKLYNLDASILSTFVPAYSHDWQYKSTAISTLLTAKALKLNKTLLKPIRTTILTTRNTNWRQETLAYTQKERLIKVMTDYTIPDTIPSDDAPLQLIVVKGYSGLANVDNMFKIFPEFKKLPAIEQLLTNPKWDKHKISVYKNNNLMLVLTQGVPRDCLPELTTNCLCVLPVVFASLFTNEERSLAQKIFYCTSQFEEDTKDCKTIRKMLEHYANLTDMKRLAKENMIIQAAEKLKANIIATINAKLDTAKHNTANALAEYIKALEIQTDLERMQPQNIDINTLTTFWKNNNSIEQIIVRSSCLYMAMNTYIEWDTNAAKTQCKNMSAFLKWLFIEQPYKIKWYSACKFLLHTHEVTAWREAVQDIPKIANTHWHAYNCFGDNKRIIQTALVKGDYLTACAQAVTAASQLNIYDTTVINTFIRKLETTYRNIEAFEDAAGNTYSYKTLVEKFEKGEIGHGTEN